MKNTSFVGAFVFALSIVLLAGCAGSSNQSPYASKPEVAADRMIQNSFRLNETEEGEAQAPNAKEEAKAPEAAKEEMASIDWTAKVVNDRVQISIMRAALDKEFLLQGNLITQKGIPMFENMKSRIVSFKKVGDEVFLLESNEGHTVTDIFNEARILTTFEVLEESDEAIVIDFDNGMNKIFTFGDWATQDYPPNTMFGDPTFAAAEVEHSFVDKAEFKNNRLYVQQFAQLKGDARDTVQVRYYLSPYEPSEDFEPTRARLSDYRHFAFFEVQPQYQLDGSQIVYASKFNINKPITWAVSSNTPKEFVKAVEDGVLYWNKVFGKEVMKVVEAPEGITAPNPDYNIVQWVDWDQAGFAFADAQMDPRTGEILHAQVYMTSVFAVMGMARARSIIKNLKDNENAAKLLKQQFGLKGMTKTRMCDRHMEAHFTRGLQTVIANGGNDETVLKMAQDYVREVVAHEIGHTLGARHNFAGNLAANYHLSERDEILEKYIETGHAPQDLVPSSSVMEYQEYIEAALSGDLIANPEAPAFEYDEKAMQTLYYGKKYHRSERPLFCTDSHVGNFADCQRFDLGTSPTEMATYSVQANLKGLAHTIVEKFIDAISPMAGEDVVPFDEIEFDPDKMAGEILGQRDAFLKAFSGNGNYLSIHRQYPVVNKLNQDEVREEQEEFIRAEIRKSGGASEVLKFFPEDYSDVVYDEILRLLEDENYTSGIGRNGKPYTLTSPQKATIRVISKLVLDHLQKALILRDLGQLDSLPTLPDNELSEDFLPVLQERLERYVFAINHEKGETFEIEVPVIEEEEEGEVQEGSEAAESKPAAKKSEPQTEWIQITIPEFVYDQNIRSKAARLIRAARAEAPDWGVKQRARNVEQFESQIDDVFGRKLDQLGSHSDLPKQVFRWISDNKSVLSALK